MSDSPSDDYPAAHSMDSAWFAVDADGNIARFDTGENGAVPNAAAPGGGNFEIDFDALLLDALLVGIALRDRHREPRSVEESSDPVPVPPMPGQTQPERVVIVAVAPSFVETDASYRQAPRHTTRAEATFRDGELVVVKDADPRIVVSLDPVPPSRVAALRAFTDAAVFVVSDLYYVLREGDGGETPDRGIFEYGHEHGVDVKGSGTYGRSVAPRTPVTLDDVHPSIREKLASLRLPLRFTESPVVELADHMGENDVQTYGTPLDPANAPPPEPADISARAVMPGRLPMVVSLLVLGVLVLLAVLRSRR